MVRISIEERARIVGLVEGGRSHSQVRAIIVNDVYNLVLFYQYNVFIIKSVVIYYLRNLLKVSKVINANKSPT